MITLHKYTEDQKETWDNFVRSSNITSFLFFRNFMDYHKDRFNDHSLIIYNDAKIIALLPANLHNNTLYSHQGLTYGGFITDATMKTALMLSIFEATISYLKTQNITEFFYKKTPQLYTQWPAEEDLYALFRHQAQLVRRDISSTINLDNKLPFNTLRKRMVKKAIKNGISIFERDSITSFYPILTENLKEKHGTKPVHSQKELQLLKTRFPEGIRFFTAMDKEENLAAAVVIFEMKNTAHAQYICSTKVGRELGGLDAIFDHLINNIYASKQYFDFGISTENNGRVLNEGLINQKEMFGGRGVCYDTYHLTF